MKKINMKAFNVTVRDGNGKEKEIKYGLKESLIEIIFNQALKLNSLKLLKQNDLAKKIETAGDELLLEEEEYVRVKEALDKVEGLGKNDVELVQRVMNAETVEVTAK